MEKQFIPTPLAAAGAGSTPTVSRTGEIGVGAIAPCAGDHVLPRSIILSMNGAGILGPSRAVSS